MVESDNFFVKYTKGAIKLECEAIKVGLKKKGAHTLERNIYGNWSLDGKVISEEEAIGELVEAVQELGYWCQVAKDVLPQKEFEMVQESYEYRDE